MSFGFLCGPLCPSWLLIFACRYTLVTPSDTNPRPFRSFPSASTTIKSAMLTVSNPANAHEYPTRELNPYSIELIGAAIRIPS
jgi:hypothetical protein